MLNIREQPSPAASARWFTVATSRQQRLGFVNDPSAGSPTETLPMQVTTNNIKHIAQLSAL